MREKIALVAAFAAVLLAAPLAVALAAVPPVAVPYVPGAPPVSQPLPAPPAASKPPAHTPHEAPRRPEGYARVVDMLRAWEIDEAGRVIAEFRRQAPGRADWDALAGAAAYLRGEYENSIDLLNRAIKGSPGDSEWLELRLHVKQSKAAVDGFAAHRTKNFEIRYDPKLDSLLLPYMSEALEAAYRAYAAELGVALTGRVRVEVFSDPGRFHKASTIRRADIEKGVVGLCKFNKMLLISPAALQRGYRWLDTAAHEFIHYLITKGTRNKAPIWLHEGIAKLFEKKWRASSLPHLNPIDEALLFRAKKKNAFISFKSMEPSLIYLKTAEAVRLAYAEGASVAEFIIRRGGKKALEKMFRAIREGDAEARSEPGPAAPAGRVGRPSLVELESTGPPQSAGPGLKALFGVGLSEFEEMWKKDLAGQTLRARSGTRVRKFRLKATGPVDESGEDLAALKSAVARRRTRLADRLWLRGRLKAAWVEYKRALRDERNSPALLNRLARVELRLGLPRKALSNLDKAVSVDPDYGVSYIHRGVAFEMTEDEKSARKAWEEAIQINPFNPLPHERLAVLYEKNGMKEKAKRELELSRQLRGS